VGGVVGTVTVTPAPAFKSAYWRNGTTKQIFDRTAAKIDGPVKDVGNLGRSLAAGISTVAVELPDSVCAVALGVLLAAASLSAQLEGKIETSGLQAGCECDCKYRGHAKP
jgi:hypothetical protein